MILIWMIRFHQMIFDKIEKTMKQIVNENHKIVREVVSKEEAKDFFKDDPYKLELIDAIPEMRV